MKEGLHCPQIPSGPVDFEVEFFFLSLVKADVSNTEVTPS